MALDDVAVSLRMIDRARLRIKYQKIAVTKLGFDGNFNNASTAGEMLASMEGRLRVLLEQHAKLIANENMMEVSG